MSRRFSIRILLRPEIPLCRLFVYWLELLHQRGSGKFQGILSEVEQPGPYQRLGTSRLFSGNIDTWAMMILGFFGASASQPIVGSRSPSQALRLV